MSAATTVRRYRPLAVTVAGVASMLLLAPMLAEAAGAMGEIAQLDPRWLVLAIGCEIASFVCCWDLLRLVLRSDGWFAVAASQLTGNAVSQVTPAGGPAGAAVQMRMLVRSGHDAPTAIAGLTASGVLSTAGLLALPVLALPSLLTGARVDSVLTTGVWASLVLLGVLVVAVIVATRDRVLVGAARGAQRVVNVLWRGNGPDNLVEHALAQRDLLRDTLRHHRGRALAASAGQALGGYLALYAALAAAGVHPNAIVVLAAFAVANVAGMVPITPAGLGFVEAGLAGVLTLGGVPYPTALIVAVTYRLVSSWLPAAAGYGAFLWTRRTRPVAAVAPFARIAPALTY